MKIHGHELIISPAGNYEDPDGQKKFSTCTGLRIFFYCETKIVARQVNSICRNFNFENYFVVDRHRMGGGLTLFWNSNVNVNITSYSAHHIDAVVCDEGERVWRCTRIYGHPEASQKHHTWKLLKRLASLFSYP